MASLSYNSQIVKEPLLQPKTSYAEWLERTSAHSLYASSEEWWRIYQKALIPASLAPRTSNISPDEAQDLLERSGAWLIRYVSRSFAEPAGFWWVECNRYDAGTPSKKARNQIRRAYRNCIVEPIASRYLQEHGYACYRAAFARYRGAKPLSPEEFSGQLKEQEDGPFELWGVFVNGELAGFANCGVEDPYIALLNMNLHPDFLDYYPAYALIDTLLAHYVSNTGRALTNGHRSINHQTEMQDFLTKFGFERCYCDLKVIYAPRVSSVIRAVYPLRSLLRLLPDFSLLEKARALLFQERLCRSFRDMEN